MILCFEFEYSNSNDNLAFFLNFYAKKSELTYSFEKDGRFLRLYIKGDQEELLKFSDEISRCVPHSIFLQNSRVFVSEEMRGEEENFKNSLSNITPSVIYDFQKGEISPCENGILSDISVFVNDELKAVTKQNFSELLEFAFRNFINGDSVKFRDLEGVFCIDKFSELDENFDILMPTNL